jgi:hypothetical protein
MERRSDEATPGGMVGRQGHVARGTWHEFPAIADIRHQIPDTRPWRRGLNADGLFLIATREGLWRSRVILVLLVHGFRIGRPGGLDRRGEVLDTDLDEEA